ELGAVLSASSSGEWLLPDGILVVAKMSDTVFFSFVIFLGSHWGTEPLSIPVIEGVENNFSSSSKHLKEDMDRLFDEIVLQVYPSNLDDAQTAGRLITGRDVNETYLHHNGISDSEFESSSHKQDEYLTKIFAHSAENKEPSLFNRDVSPQLTAEDNETLQKSTRGASRESLPCGQLLSFLQKNIISATVAMAAVLLVTVLVVFTLVTYKRRRQTKYPPANMTYNIFIMNGKSLWQNSQDKDLKKFMGKPKHLKYNSFV
ncbi:mCG17758, isoform CRA_b, partial [Mus musculus]